MGEQIERLPPFDQGRMTPVPAVEVTPAMAEAVIAEGQKDIFRDRPSDIAWGSDSGIDVYSWLVKAGEVVSAWWSKRRDADLRRFWLGSDHLSSALYNLQARMTGIPVQVVPRDTTVQSQIQLAAKFQDILMNKTESRSDRSRVGWEHGFGLFLLDAWTQDNGAFMAVDGPGRADGPLTGAPKKLIHLDSWRCTRTDNEKYPVVFQDRDGKWYKLHRARVMAYASLASSIAGMHGVGFCGASRSINNVQHMIDIGVYKQEKLGSRPARQMIIGEEGVTAEDIGRAFYVAEEQMDNQGLSRYAKNVVIAPKVRSAAAKVSINVRDLASVPDGFDEYTSTTLAMYCIAMAFGVPARWLWPATSVGATKADALLQHTVGLTLGPAEILRAVTRLLETKFLPPTLAVKTDFQDDEQDRAVAEIRKTRSEQRKNDLETQVINVRVAREQALAAGDITESQFRQLEMEDGRQEDGSDVLTMFYSPDPALRDMLRLNVEMPLAVDANDPIDMLLEIETAAMGVQERIAVARTASQKLKAQQALAALTKLKSMYEKQAQAQVQSEMGEQIMEDATSGVVEEPAQPGQQGGPQGVAEGQPQEGEAPGQPGQKGILGWFKKAFDFGVGTGGIIGGALARGGGGEFVNVADLQASMQRELARRMAGRRMTPEQRAANRATVAEALGIDQSVLDQMDAMQDKPPDKETQDKLIDMGLGRRNEQGIFSLTSAGIMFRNAMNAGNVERAKLALSSADQAKGKAPKGAGGKPDKEAQKRENREQVKGKIEDEIDPKDFDALVEFGEGNDIPEETAKRLAAKGLLEYDADGNLRTTRDYKAFMKAAEAGDSRAAQDALSRASERVATVREKVSSLRSSAESIAMDVQQAIFDYQTVEGSQSIPDQLKAARLAAKIRRLIDRMNKMTEQADKLESGIGGPLPEKEEEEKGSAASGNWLHTSFNRMDVGRGGSDPSGAHGGGLAALGLDVDSTPEERRAVSEEMRKLRVSVGRKRGVVEKDMFDKGRLKVNGILNEGLGEHVDWTNAPYEEKLKLQLQLAKDLGERAGVDEGTANAMMGRWISTSGDSDMRALGMQESAAHVFGAPLSDFTQSQIDMMNERLEQKIQTQMQKHGQTYEEASAMWRKQPMYSSIADKHTQAKVIRAMYDMTQEKFREAGLRPGDTVRLYRGLNLTKDQRDRLTKGDVTPIIGNTMESWTTSRYTATGFGSGGAVFAMDVPIEMIISTARTGFGCLGEGEVVVMGSFPGSKALVRDKP